jgi:hypothetical protein
MMCKSLGSALITILMLALGSHSDGTLLCGFAGHFSIVMFHVRDKPRHHFVQKLPGSTISNASSVHRRKTRTAGQRAEGYRSGGVILFLDSLDGNSAVFMCRILELNFRTGSRSLWGLALTGLGQR